MAKAKTKRVYKIVRWMQDHEPPGKVRTKGAAPEPFAGPIRFYRVPVHTGQGRDELIDRHGAERALALVGLFDLLAQRCAGLEFARRGFVLGRNGALLPCAKLAAEMQLDPGWLAQALEDLRLVGWLRLVQFRPNRRPLGARRAPETDTKTEKKKKKKNETERESLDSGSQELPRDSASDSKSGSASASSNGDGRNPQTLALLLRCSPGRTQASPRSKQYRADMTTFDAIIAQTQPNQWPEVKDLAIAAANNAQPGTNPVALFVSKAKSRFDVRFDHG